jgi:hypothetical protein
MKEDLTQEEETRATILGLCNWLEAATVLLPHAPPYNPDTLSFVSNLRGAVDAARSLVGAGLRRPPIGPINKPRKEKRDD